MTPRVEFLDLLFDAWPADKVHRWIAGRSASSDFGYVVTPNVDHMVRLATADPDVREAYDRADLCLCDSRVLKRLAGLFGVELTVVPGSDLVAVLFDRLLKDTDCVCLVGGTADHALALQRRYPLITVLHHEPPMGLRDNPVARAVATEFAASAAARITLLAVGSPQQELLARDMALSGSVYGTALCIGASVDFLIGVQSRAPIALQRLGLEWSWRLANEPRRLARRYLVEGPAIFPMALRWWWRGRK